MSYWNRGPSEYKNIHTVAYSAEKAITENLYNVVDENKMDVIEDTMRRLLKDGLFNSYTIEEKFKDSKNITVGVTVRFLGDEEIFHIFVPLETAAAWYDGGYE